MGVGFVVPLMEVLLVVVRAGAGGGARRCTPPIDCERQCFLSKGVCHRSRGVWWGDYGVNSGQIGGCVFHGVVGWL